MRRNRPYTEGCPLPKPPPYAGGLSAIADWGVGLPLCDNPPMTSHSKRARTGETVREEAVNVLLGELLRARGIPARAERRSEDNAPDLRFELPSGELILIECKWEGGRAELDRQLAERVEDFPEAVARLGVLYPDYLKIEDDVGDVLSWLSDLQWYLHSSRGQIFPDPGLTKGQVQALAAELRLLPLTLEGTDRVHAATLEVGYALTQAVKGLNTHARVAYLVSEVVAETDNEQEREAAKRIGCLVLFNALAFHRRLALVRGDIPAVEEVAAEGVKPLQAAWEAICTDIDYVPVFQVAREILRVLGYGDPEHQQPVLRPLLEAVHKTRHLEGHDLAGRLFHTLLSDAKFSGAYYTSVPAAAMLAHLVFDGWPQNVDWSDHEFPASLNVADLACGTGTLLMAVAAETQRRHADAGGRDAASLHKHLVEQALIGFDVQLSAIHFAATSLAMLNPDIQFDKMNLYTMPLGVESDEIRLGSLEFLGSREAPVQMSLGGGGDLAIKPQDVGRVSGEGIKGAAEGVTVRLPDLDLVIMNPPFTRSVGGNLLFGSLPQPERTKLQAELKRRLKTRNGAVTAGLGSAFVAAAAPKLRPGEGRLALVLPLTVCTGPSWQQTRSLIERDFTLDTVITTHDPERWNFSDSTDLSEALLIATRRVENGDPPDYDTRFVSLWRNPRGVIDAQKIAQAVETTAPARIEEDGTSLLSVDGRHLGEVMLMPSDQILDERWLGVQFARADVTRIASRLLREGSVRMPGAKEAGSVPLTTLTELGQVGPDVRDVWDGFERTQSVTAYEMIDGHDTNKRTTLLAEPDNHLSPLTAPRPRRKLKPLDLLWPKAGKLLIGERLWLNTCRTIAICTPRQVLSNVFWPVNVGDTGHERPLALWLNSSLGLLSLLATRNTTRGPWVKLKKADLAEMPILDVRQLSQDQLDAFNNLFEQLAEHHFLPLPEMAEDPTRAALDDGLANILNLPNLSPLRRLLASEPVISNRRL